MSITSVQNDGEYQCDVPRNALNKTDDSVHTVTEWASARYHGTSDVPCMFVEQAVRAVDIFPRTLLSKGLIADYEIVGRWIARIQL